MFGSPPVVMERYPPAYGPSAGAYVATSATGSAAQPQWQMQQHSQRPGPTSTSGTPLPGQVADGGSAGSNMCYFMVPMPYSGGTTYGGAQQEYRQMPSGQFHPPVAAQEQYGGYWAQEGPGYACATGVDPNYSRWTSETSYSSEQHWASGVGGDAASGPWQSEGRRSGSEGNASANKEAAAAATTREAATAAANPAGRRGPGSSLQRRRRRQRATRQPSQHREHRADHDRPRHADADAEGCAELTARLNAGGEETQRAVAALLEPGVVCRLSFEPAGCRVVQLALETVDRQTAADLAIGLKGFVAEGIRSPHANYVLQKVIKVLTAKEAGFLVEEVSEASLDLARHEYGCRIYCRLLEHMASDPAVARLIDDVLRDTEELLRHTFGHHVVECALEHGLPHQRQKIIASLRKNLLRSAWNRNAAYVVEKALLYGNLEDQTSLATDLLACTTTDLAQLARSQFGSMVVRALLRLPGPVPQRVHEHLSSASAQAQLKTTKHGRRLLEDHGLGAAPGGDRAKADGEGDRSWSAAHEHLCL